MEIKSVSLKNYSSLNVGGEGRAVSVTNTASLVEVLMYAKKEEKVLYFLGTGTNTYFGDDLENFLFIKMDIKGISFEEQNDEVFITAYAGEVWDDVVRFSVEKNLWGIENLSLIPGTIGAAPVQNIGAYGVELKDVFVSLSAIDTTTLDMVEMDASACDFGYRDSFFKKEKGRYIIISVTIKLSKKRYPQLAYKPLDSLIGKEASLQSIRDLVAHTRTAKLPDWYEHANAGSFFKNPTISASLFLELQKMYPEIPRIEFEGGYKIPAAWLIEHVAQMKGVRRGDVGTWLTQPLVLVNYGDATANDIDSFATEIKEKIHQKTGILLEQEVNRVG